MTLNNSIAISNILIVVDNFYFSQIKNFKFWPGSNFSKKDIQFAEQIAKELEEFGLKVSSLSIKSQIEFTKGNIPKSISLAKNVALATNNVASACFSLAFLNYYQGDLEQGWIWLKRAIEKKHHPQLLEQIITITIWYDQSILEDKKKQYLNFPLGIIYWDIMKDKKLGKKALDIFYKKYKTENTQVFNNMIFQTNKRLRKIKRGR